MDDPLLLPSDLLGRQEFKDLVERRIAVVREQRGNPPDADFLADMLAKTQELVKSLQAQLDKEKRENQQQVKALTEKYERELGELRVPALDCSLKDKSAAEVRDVLFAELRTREVRAAQAAELSRTEISRLHEEVRDLRAQLVTAQSALDSEHKQRPQATEQQKVISQLESQVATLMEKLQTQPLSFPVSHRSETPSLPDFNISEQETAKSNKAEVSPAIHEEHLAQLTAEKEKAERTLELMLKISSEKEAELTEEAERLRLVNSSFLEFSNKNEEWIRVGFEVLTKHLASMSSAYAAPGLEATVRDSQAIVSTAQAAITELRSAESEDQAVLVEALHALDKLQQLHSGGLQKTVAPAPRLDYPGELLAACAQLQKDLAEARELQVKDHQDLAKNLSFVANSAAEREEELLTNLQEHAHELRFLREQVSDWQDLHLEEELRMAKANNTRLLAEVDTAKRYILVLAACVQSLQSLITELATDKTTDTRASLQTEIQRLQQENELLLSRMHAETEEHNASVSTLQEELSKSQSEIRQLRIKLDQYHQIQLLKEAENSRMWKDQVRLLTLSNEQLRRNCADIVAQTSKQRLSQYERAEVEGLKRVLELKNFELTEARTLASTNFQAILSALQGIRSLLEFRPNISANHSKLDEALAKVSAATESMLAFQQKESQRLRDLGSALTASVEDFHKKLEDVANLANRLFSACGLNPVDVKEKQYFAQSLEKLQTMHEAEVESFRLEVMQIEEQFSLERRRACEIAKQLQDSMQYRQAVLDEMQQVSVSVQETEDPEEQEKLQTRLRGLDQEIERHQQWELSLIDSLLRLIDKSGNAIEEVNESCEVSETDSSRLSL